MRGGVTDGSKECKMEGEGGRDVTQEGEVRGCHKLAR